MVCRHSVESGFPLGPEGLYLFSIIVSLSKPFERMFSFILGLAHGGRWNASCGRCRGV